MCTPSSPPSVLAYFLIAVTKFMTTATPGSEGLCGSCRKAEGVVTVGRQREVDVGALWLACFIHFWKLGSQAVVTDIQGAS